MNIDISPIIDLNGAGLKFSGDISFCDMSFNDSKLNSPVKVIGEIKNFSGEYNIAATLTAEFKLSCARCLKTFLKTVKVPMEETLNSEESMDYLKLVHHSIDITDAVYTNLILSLSDKFICDKNCKGLCSVCGADLNEKECGCDRQFTDPRFDILKNLLK